MRNSSFTLTALASALALASVGAHAEVRWNGALNAGFAVSDSGTEYLDRIDDTGDFRDSGFGVNASADLGNDWTVAGQLFSHEGGEAIDFDWGFATYQASDAVSLRFGKLKYPGNLVSEIVDVGYAYPWIRPPEVIYSHTDTGAAMTMEALQGASAEYTVGGDEWEWSVMGYAGEANEDEMSHTKIHAARVSLSNDNVKFLAGYNRSLIDAPDLVAGELNDKWMSIATLGAQAELNDWVGYAEYVQSTTEDVDPVETTGWYVTVGHRFGEFMPHLTYADLSQESGIAQDSWTLGTRWDMAPSTALKVEWQRIDPTAADAAAPGSQTYNVAYNDDGEPFAGMFSELPEEDSVNVFSVMLNYTF